MSAKIAQDHVAIHSGAGSRAVRLLNETKDAFVRTWILDNRCNYTLVMDFNAAEIKKVEVDGWIVYLDSELLNKLSGFREDRLPNETCGVLLGSHDNERKIIYLVDALPSPPDSIEKTN